MKKIIEFSICILLFFSILSAVYTCAGELQNTDSSNLGSLQYDPKSHDFGSISIDNPGVYSTVFEIWRGGGCCEMTFSLTENSDWIDVFPKSGSSHGNRVSITVEIDTNRLDIGSYSYGIQIHSTYGDKVFTVNVTIFGDEDEPPYTPADPNPDDDGNDVNINIIISWTGGDPDPNDSVTYDVYFGTSSSPPLVKSDHNTVTYNPGVLNFNTWYYWKIVARDSHGKTSSGPVWKFLTMEDFNTPPDKPKNPFPNDGTADVKINIALDWTGNDQDPDDTLTYDVYFGTSSNPSKIASYISESFYNPGTLEYKTKYYWKIVARDNHQSTNVGPVWNFTTEEELDKEISIEIDTINFGIVKANIINEGEGNIDILKWNITIKGGFLNRIDVSNSGTIFQHASGASEKINSDFLIKSGFCLVDVNVNVDVEGKKFLESKTGFLLGKILIMLT
jgi:hypothetical protein